MKWTRETLRHDLLQIFNQHNQAGIEVSEASDIVGDLGIDSLGQMELIADVEDKFGLNIPDEALRDMHTIGDVVVTIEGRLAEHGRLEG